jgi:hypothetical protein
MPRRTAIILGVLLAMQGAAAAGPAVHRMTAEFDYALRNRLEDRDGFWFATFELRGHVFPNDAPERTLDLDCIGAAWGFAASLGGEETMCRLAEGATVLHARLRSAEGTAREAVLGFELHGGRGAYAGYAGRATAHRVMDLSGERPTGRGSLSLRLVLEPAINEGE